jgi:hypothetical protein
MELRIRLSAYDCLVPPKHGEERAITPGMEREMGIYRH